MYTYSVYCIYFDPYEVHVNFLSKLSFYNIYGSMNFILVSLEERSEISYIIGRSRKMGEKMIRGVLLEETGGKV